MGDSTKLDELGLLETRHLQLLEAILSLDRALAAIPQDAAVGAILDTVNFHLKQALNFQAVAFLLVNPHDLTYQLAFADPPEEKLALSRETEQAIETGVFGWTLKRGQALVQMAEDSRQFVLHPLSTRRSTVGMLAAFAHHDFNTSPSSLVFLSVIMSKVALSIENGLLYAELREHNHKLKHTVGELRASEARLTNILEKMPVGVAIVSEEAGIIWLNEALRTIVGAATKEEVISRKCANAICGLASPCLRGAQADREQKIVRKDGEVITVLHSVHPIEVGGVEHSLCIFFDITTRIALETDLNRARKLEAIGQLAAGIAHEINTPAQFVGDSIHFLSDGFKNAQRVLGAYRQAVGALAAIPGQETLAQRLREAEDAADLAYLEENGAAAFGRAEEGISRIAAIVRAMKEFAHPDQRDKEPADINRALQTTLTIAKNEYKYVADVETTLGDIPLVRCHLGDINQVFLNLLVNAGHAILAVVGKSGRRGKILVRTMREGGDVRIDITDTGCGISNEIKDRIFDPFFTTKEVGRGTGQGLAIARAIVSTKHHGSLTFESEVGKGTTFTVRLPVDIDGNASVDSQT